MLIRRSEEKNEKKHQTRNYSEKSKISAYEKELLSKLRTTKDKYSKKAREGRKSKKRKLLKLLMNFGFER